MLAIGGAVQPRRVGGPDGRQHILGECNAGKGAIRRLANGRNDTRGHQPYLVIRNATTEKPHAKGEERRTDEPIRMHRWQDPERNATTGKHVRAAASSRASADCSPRSAKLLRHAHHRDATTCWRATKTAVLSAFSTARALPPVPCPVPTLATGPTLGMGGSGFGCGGESVCGFVGE